MAIHEATWNDVATHEAIKGGTTAQLPAKNCSCINDIGNRMSVVEEQKANKNTFADQPGPWSLDDKQGSQIHHRLCCATQTM